MPILFNRRSLISCFAAVVSLIVLHRAALSAPIGIVGSGSQYGTIESTTGVYTSRGRLTDSFNGNSILLSGATYGTDGNLYGVTGVDGPGANNEGNYLWRFNPATGVSTDRHTLSVSFVSVATRPSDGLLFGYSNDGNGDGSFYSVNLQTYTPTYIGTSNVLSFGAVTFDDASNLYMADSSTGDIYRINTSTGSPTLFTQTNIPDISGMAVIGNTLQFFDIDTKGRYNIDLSNGAVTFQGNYNIGGNAGSDLIYGAALAPMPVIVPEAGTASLLALAAVPLVYFHRRRKNTMSSS